MLSGLSSSDPRNVRGNVQNAIDSLRTNDPGFQPDANLRETAARLLETFGPDGVRTIAQAAKDPEVKFPMPTAMKKFDTAEAARDFLAAVETAVIQPTKLQVLAPTPTKATSDRSATIEGINKALKGESETSRSVSGGTERSRITGTSSSR